MAVSDKARFKIWIGDRIVGIENFANINFHNYLANRQMIIASFSEHMFHYDRSTETQIQERFKNQGGTLFEFSNGQLKLIDYAMAGTENLDSWTEFYLASSVDFGNMSTNRVRYTNPEKRNAICSRVITASGAYMITYNVKDIGETFKVFDDFIAAINPLRTHERFLAGNQGGNIAPKHTTQSVENHTVTTTTINTPSPLHGISSGQALTVGGAIGVAADIGIGLAVDSVIGGLDFTG